MYPREAPQPIAEASLMTAARAATGLRHRQDRRGHGEHASAPVRDDYVTVVPTNPMGRATISIRP
jgi:hypothetical protein